MQVLGSSSIKQQTKTAFEAFMHDVLHLRNTLAAQGTVLLIGRYHRFSAACGILSRAEEFVVLPQK